MCPNMDWSVRYLPGVQEDDQDMLAGVARAPFTAFQEQGKGT